MILDGTLGGVTLQPFNIPFLETPLENAVDVTALSFKTYTDFVNQKREWEISWKVLTESQYNDLKAVFNSQFATGDYPNFVVPYYSIDVPVRVYINSKDIRKNGCQVWNVGIRLVEREPDSSIGDVS